MPIRRRKWIRRDNSLCRRRIPRPKTLPHPSSSIWLLLERWIGGWIDETGVRTDGRMTREYTNAVTPAKSGFTHFSRRSLNCEVVGLDSFGFSKSKTPPFRSGSRSYRAHKLWSMPHVSMISFFVLGLAIKFILPQFLYVFRYDSREFVLVKKEDQ